jgi:phage tail protein X
MTNDCLKTFSLIMPRIMSNYLPIHPQREVKMQTVIRYGTAVVVIHAIVDALHGLAHIEIPVALSPLQILFVGSAIALAPIAATILLWTRFQWSTAIWAL